MLQKTPAIEDFVDALVLDLDAWFLIHWISPHFFPMCCCLLCLIKMWKDDM